MLSRQGKTNKFVPVCIYFGMELDFISIIRTFRLVVFYGMGDSSSQSITHRLRIHREVSTKATRTRMVPLAFSWVPATILELLPSTNSIRVRNRFSLFCLLSYHILILFCIFRFYMSPHRQMARACTLLFILAECVGRRVVINQVQIVIIYIYI